MTFEEAKKKFHIRDRVKLISNSLVGQTWTKIPIGSIGTIRSIGVNIFHKALIVVEWDHLPMSWCDEFGIFADLLDNLQESDKISDPNYYNDTCEKCGSPLYRGLFTIKCSGGCNI